MVLIHGFSGTPATWTPVLPALEQQHDVLALTLLGHRCGPEYLVGSPATPAAIADALERDMDAVGVDRAHLVGNSLGGWLALELAVRGRALSTTALAPAGGWAPRGPEARRLGCVFRYNERVAKALGPRAAPAFSRCGIAIRRGAPGRCARWTCRRDDRGCRRLRDLSAAAGAPGSSRVWGAGRDRLTGADRVGYEGSHPALARLRRTVSAHDPSSAVDRACRTRPLSDARRRPAHDGLDPRVHSTSRRSAWATAAGVERAVFYLNCIRAGGRPGLLLICFSAASLPQTLAVSSATARGHWSDQRQVRYWRPRPADGAAVGAARRDRSLAALGDCVR